MLSSVRHRGGILYGRKPPACQAQNKAPRIVCMSAIFTHTCLALHYNPVKWAGILIPVSRLKKKKGNSPTGRYQSLA